jgi:hypothetical protein
LLAQSRRQFPQPLLLRRRDFGRARGSSKRYTDSKGNEKAQEKPSSPIGAFRTGARN